MSSRSLGVVSLERFLSAERYRQSRSTHRVPTAGPVGPDSRAKPERGRANGTPNSVR
jgi:hypothetical protein